MACPVPVATLQVIGGAGKGEHSPSMLESGDTAGVVEMKVRQHDVGDFFPGAAGPEQVPVEAVMRLVDGIDVPMLVVPFRPDPRVHQHPPSAVLDQQTAERQLDAVSFVGGMTLLPERFGHDAEHRATVEREGAVADLMQREISEAMGHGFSTRAVYRSAG